MISAELLSPVTWRGKTMPTRIVFAPINPGFAPEGRPTARFLRFHRGRSGNGVGLSFIGNVAVLHSGQSNAATPVLSTERESHRFAVARRAIQEAGSLAGIQLAMSPLHLQPGRIWRAPDTGREVERLASLVQACESSDLDAVVDRFVQVAGLASRVAFDVVQIHAAHGYLLSLLLDSDTNRRTDDYSVAGEWIDRFIRRLREAVGPSLLSFRVNAFSGIGARRSKEHAAIRLAMRLYGAGVDIVDFSAGFYTVDRRLIYPAERGRFPLYSIAAAVAAETLRLVTFTGGVHDLRALPDRLPPNMLVGIGRGLIADPQLVIKSAEGRFDEVVWCARKNKCHYFSRGLTGIECGVNEDI